MHLPQRLFLKHGGYYYANRVGGALDWLPLGRDEAAAIEHAKQLNRATRQERLRIIGAYRTPCETLRQQIFTRDGFRCVYCGSDRDLGIDHIIPYCQGGSSQRFNLVTACSDCNASKGQSDPRDFILSLIGMRTMILKKAIEYSI